VPQHIADLPTLVVVSGSSYSNAIGIFDDATAITIFTAATMTSTGLFVEVEPTATGTNFVTLQSGGVDVCLSPGKATILNKVGWRQLRLAAPATEGGARSCPVTKSVTVG
jgi:hypothetical protein